MTATSLIDAESPAATLINMFVVRPERQRELVDALTRATDEVMQHIPGFISANIHASADGQRVVNYAQWASADHFQAMLSHPDVRQHFDEITKIVDSADPRLYTVEAVRHV